MVLGLVQYLNASATVVIIRSWTLTLREKSVKVRLENFASSTAIFCNIFFVAVPVAVCGSITVGLVRYPTTLAPTAGSDTVTAYCTDNAHISSSSLSVTCEDDGSWSGPEPQCECHEGYREEVNDHGVHFCQGLVTTKE